MKVCHYSCYLFCILVLDGYDTNNLLLGWLSGEEAVEINEELEMPQFELKGVTAIQCIRKYKTGNNLIMLSSECNLQLNYEDLWYYWTKMLKKARVLIRANFDSVVTYNNRDVMSHII